MQPNTHITEDLLSLGHPAQLGAVVVREEHGLLLIPVLSVQFLNTEETPHTQQLHRIVLSPNVTWLLLLLLLFISSIGGAGGWVVVVLQANHYSSEAPHACDALVTNGGLCYRPLVIH